MIKLKIVMLTTFYPPYSYGGDAIGVERLASAMAKQGHHVTVVHDINAYNTLSDAKSPEITPAENIKVIGLRSNIGFISNLLTHLLGPPLLSPEYAPVNPVLTSVLRGLAVVLPEPYYSGFNTH